MSGVHQEKASSSSISSPKVPRPSDESDGFGQMEKKWEGIIFCGEKSVGSLSPCTGASFYAGVRRVSIGRQGGEIGCMDTLLSPPEAAVISAGSRGIIGAGGTGGVSFVTIFTVLRSLGRGGLSLREALVVILLARRPRTHPRGWGLVRHVRRCLNRRERVEIARGTQDYSCGITMSGSLRR